MFRSLARIALPLATRGVRLVAVRTSSQYLQRLATPTASVVQQKRFAEAKDTNLYSPPKPLTFKEVEERVLKAIKAWDRFPQDRLDKLHLDARFIEDLGLDSLDHVEIVMSLEDEFGFEIPDTEAEKLKSPRDICKYINEREDVYE
ncbi:acyl carrier protein [Aphelenchoides avenae]|nr:acyl carrier protein [Aphelenchus avenae]